MKIHHVLFLAIFGVLMGKPLLIAQAIANPSELKYPGSEQKMEDSVGGSDAIFIGQVIAKGAVILTSPGISSRGFTVKVITVLKGTVDSEIQVRLDVRNDSKVIESVPQVGQSYLFFTKLRANHIIALKILAGTDSNITSVRQAIAKVPK